MKCVKVLLAFCMLLCPNLLMSQTVSVIGDGEGVTIEEATKSALLSAIEQAYGVFVSANTVVLNDELVRDEMTSLSRGNIQRYQVLSTYDTTPKRVIVKAVVSIDRMVEYAKSKGMEAELAGSTFAMNIKLLKLNLKNAATATAHLATNLDLAYKNMYDYHIEVGEPYLKGSETEYERAPRGALGRPAPARGEMACVDVKVKCLTNRNAIEFYKMYRETMVAILQSINTQSVKGSLDNNEDIAAIQAYNNVIKELPKIYCMNFDVFDNLGDKVNVSLGNRSFASQRGSTPRDSLMTGIFVGGQMSYLKGKGVQLMQTNTQTTAGPVTKPLFVYNNRCYNSDGNMISGPQHKNRRNTNRQHKERLTYAELNNLTYFDMERGLPLPAIGEVHGTFCFTIVYTQEQISRVSGIRVRPN